MAQPYIFLINGPPGAGKDTLGHFLTERTVSSAVVKFAAPIKRAAAGIYGREDFLAHDNFEVKNEPAAAFLGKSCREVQIAISEQFMKQFHGIDVFGRFLARDITIRNQKQDIDNFFVTDSGFLDEAKVLVDTFGADRIILFRIHREGHTFSGDSRGYIDLSELGVQQFDIKNNGTPEEFCNEAYKIVQDIILNRTGAN